jgi:hypothetical protein
MGDAPRGHLHEAAGANQVLDPARFVQQFFMALRVREDGANPGLSQSPHGCAEIHTQIVGHFKQQVSPAIPDTHEAVFFPGSFEVGVHHHFGTREDQQGDAGLAQPLRELPGGLPDPVRIDRIPLLILVRRGRNHADAFGVGHAAHFDRLFL